MSWHDEDSTGASLLSPGPLKPGDKIALISPASVVKDEYVFGAMERIREFGYEPLLMPHAIGHSDGSFAASKVSRLSDLMDALDNPEIKAILCTRGGYGCSQLLANFSYGKIHKSKKWIIGFSDVSALLAMWYRSDLTSIHGPMAKHLAMRPKDDPSTSALFRILETGGQFNYTVSPHKYNQEGYASGILRGGNLAVLNDLAGTPYDILDISGDENVILFLEDINEPIYAVNRMLWRLNLSGALTMVKGIIFGQFTDYKPDKNFETMEDMIHHMMEYSAVIPPFIPIAFNFPTGHTDLNYPLVEGANVELEVTDLSVRLRTIP